MKRIPIDRIEVGTHRRALKDLKALASSIEDVGLLNPITVRKDGNGYRLVAGYHRLEACKAIGWLEIDATVVDLNDLEAELAEIDENLIRHDLSDLERGEELSHRKAVHAELHPEAVLHGGDRKSSRQVGGLKTPGFVAETSAISGRSERSIQRDIQIAESIPQDVRDKLRHTPVANNQRDLETIARQPVDVQREVAFKVWSGQARDVTRALIGMHKAAGGTAQNRAVRPNLGLYRPGASPYTP